MFILRKLSLKAKGLLSQMLSLPEDWDYTLAVLSLINREKIDAIREAVRELERTGYIVRSRERDDAAFRVGKRSSKGFIPLPPKMPFYCVTFQYLHHKKTGARWLCDSCRVPALFCSTNWQIIDLIRLLLLRPLHEYEPLFHHHVLSDTVAFQYIV